MGYLIAVCDDCEDEIKKLAPASFSTDDHSHDEH
jgi:hypothetical protein